jgi:hypothetical protein
VNKNSQKNNHNKPNKTKREEEDEYLFHDGVMHFMERKNQNKMHTCSKRKKIVCVGVENAYVPITYYFNVSSYTT